jgi:hypothetical protein
MTTCAIPCHTCCTENLSMPPSSSGLSTSGTTGATRNAAPSCRMPLTPLPVTSTVVSWSKETGASVSCGSGTACVGRAVLTLWRRKTSTLVHLVRVAAFLSQPSFLHLKRHIVWMHGLQCMPGPPGRADTAWVFDGVQVSGARRHVYTGGRPHLQPPHGDETRKKAGSTFRQRLMIPDPSHRSALKTLLQKCRVTCTPGIVGLARWLHDDGEEGGWMMRPYIPLEWVSEAHGGTVCATCM